MPLKFLDSSPYLNKIPKDIYKDDFNQLLTEYFYTSPDWHTIQEQLTIGSDIYSEIDVRIVHAVNNEYGTIQNDDYKIILFKELNHGVTLGQYYQFDNNYWIVVNADSIKSLTSSCAVRRCNNVLRWLDPDGSIYQVPVAITELIRENRDYATAGSALVSPSGVLEFTTQLNAKTNRIRPNQRFIFGNRTDGFNNWTAWKVQGGGINNFNNLQTTNNNSASLLRITMTVNYINEDTDDLVNGIPDALQYVYLVSLNKTTASIIEDGTAQLSANISLNGESVTRAVTWSTGDDDVAIVSTNGLVTAKAVGTCKIRATLTNNSTTYAECDVTVTAVPPSQTRRIVISPEKNFVLEGQSQSYAVTLYADDFAQADAFTFTVVNTGVPTENYTFISGGSNEFAISNLKMYLDSDLRIRCTSGATSRDFDVKLKGAW